jgi:hypothetical protein
MSHAATPPRRHAATPCAIRPGLAQSIARVREAFFRRDPARWPGFLRKPCS